jgi:thioredoxin-like negative regulator of GroEL
MTERLIVATVVLLVIWGGGVVVRRWWRARAWRLAARAVLDGPRQGVPQILTFYGPRCETCETQKRIFEELDLNRNPLVRLQYVDAVADFELSRKFGVMIVPTTVIAAADGRIIDITCGLLRPEQIESRLAMAA